MLFSGFYGLSLIHILPPGKKPFVTSQDDVCYYDYMKGDGFATRIVIGDDGKPTCEMELDDGTVGTGSFDLVPLMEDFIAEHPDFSYKGARAVLAVTGYQGVLGYRTDPEYKDSDVYKRQLISSLIIFPALTSMRVFKSFSGVILSAGTVSVVCFFIGLVLSYVYSIPAGASVVVVNMGAFGIFSVIQAVRRR